MPITASDRKAKTAPYLFKCFEASTGHITKTDRNLLDCGEDRPICVYKYDYGWFVYVGGDRLTPTDRKNLKENGFSDTFLHLLEMAGKNECKFLALDADGFVYSDLPTFDW